MSTIPTYEPDVDLSNVLNKTVNDIFKPTFRNQDRYLVLFGGAGSGKSRYVAQKILYRLIYEENHRFLIVRKVEKTLKLSVFQLFKDYIHKWDIASKFKITVSPMKITHIASGNTIDFMGVDNPEKLKSIEGITSLWIEEASELEEDDFNELDRRIRGNTKHYKQIIITFNPISHLHWLKSRFIDNPPLNCTTLKTTYLDNRFIDDVYIGVLLEMEKYDLQQYRIYALGEWGILNQNIIHHRYDFKRHISDKTVKDFYTLHIGIDFNIGGCVGVALGEDNQGISHVVDEFCVYDTEMIIQELIARYPNKSITLYPDASGSNRSTSSRQTDVDMLKGAGFYCVVPDANGATATRYNACNRKFMDNEILINPRTTSKTNESLQVHAYDEKGMPEKFKDHKGGAVDDYTDAFGYIIVRLYPIVVPLTRVKMGGT